MTLVVESEERMVHKMVLELAKKMAMSKVHALVILLAYKLVMAMV